VDTGENTRAKEKKGKSFKEKKEEKGKEEGEKNLWPASGGDMLEGQSTESEEQNAVKMTTKKSEKRIGRGPGCGMGPKEKPTRKLGRQKIKRWRRGGA